MSSNITDDWNKLRNVLLDFSRVSSGEIEYLRKAFYKTETLWAENLEKLKKVRLVMLSEAPFFGENKSYFYNPISGFTPFFHFNDAESILGNRFARIRLDSQKQSVLDEFAKTGFVVLDIFPFAFNDIDTPSITYRELSKSKIKYQQLFNDTVPLYFRKKLKQLLKRGYPYFVFRYGRLQKNIGALVNEELVKWNLDKADSIHGRYKSLNRVKLRQIAEERLHT